MQGAAEMELLASVKIIGTSVTDAVAESLGFNSRLTHLWHEDAVQAVASLTQSAWKVAAGAGPKELVPAFCQMTSLFSGPGCLTQTQSDPRTVWATQALRHVATYFEQKRAKSTFGRGIRDKGPAPPGSAKNRVRADPDQTQRLHFLPRCRHKASCLWPHCGIEVSSPTVKMVPVHSYNSSLDQRSRKIIV